jgi:hypothetical protein
MNRKCFGLDVTLEVYERNGSNYIDCLCREKSLLLLPEEEVRQAVLFYLYYLAKIDLKKFYIKVEHNSLDIAFYFNYACTNFFPSQSPAIIFELKRDYTNIEECVLQLKNYLERFKCKNGVLTNSSEILFVQRGPEYKVRKIGIVELEEEVNQFTSDVDVDILNFKLANQGDLDAFLYLINKFGKTSKFTFTCTDYPIPITCFFFDVINDYVLFNFCNTESRRKQPKILKSSFIKLISIHE